MKLMNVKALALGVVEKPAGEYRGEKYDGYAALGYVIAGTELEPGEIESRKFYLPENDYSLKRAAKQLNWGDYFTFNGSIDSKGHITISSISSEEGVIDA